VRNAVDLREAREDVGSVEWEPRHVPSQQLHLASERYRGRCELGDDTALADAGQPGDEDAAPTANDLAKSLSRYTHGFGST
jgi:hypothetical protein